MAAPAIASAVTVSAVAIAATLSVGRSLALPVWPDYHLVFVLAGLAIGHDLNFYRSVIYIFI